LKRRARKNQICNSFVSQKMNVILDSERDRRTLAWLVEQVGECALEKACASLVGQRKPYPSNLAKILGLVPPERLTRPTSAQVHANLAAARKLLASPPRT
jgi:hypothetical protein